MQFKFIAASFALSLSGCVSPNGIAQPVASVTPNAKADPAKWPAAASPKTLTSTATEDAISATLKQMSLEQKVGQLVQADISAITSSGLGALSAGLDIGGRQFWPLW